MPNAGPHPAPPDALPAAVRLGAVTLQVLDVDAEVAFYRDALGLDVRAESPREIVLGTAARALVRLRPGAAGRRPPAAPGLYHLALLLPDRSALGAWLEHALGRAVALQGAADHGVSEAVYLADPEGNGIEVYRDRPRAAWDVVGGDVRMVTEPLDAAGVVATATAAWRGAPDATRIGHVHLQVAELAGARAFYQRAVGFPVTNDRFPGACFLGAGGYHHHIGLNTWNVAPSAARDARAAGLTGFELHVPAPADRAALAGRLRREGRQAREEDGVLVTRDADGVELRVSAGEVNP